MRVNLEENHIFFFFGLIHLKFPLLLGLSLNFGEVLFALESYLASGVWLFSVFLRVFSWSLSGAFCHNFSYIVFLCLFTWLLWYFGNSPFSFDTTIFPWICFISLSLLDFCLSRFLLLPFVLCLLPRHLHVRIYINESYRLSLYIYLSLVTLPACWAVCWCPTHLDSAPSKLGFGTVNFWKQTILSDVCRVFNFQFINDVLTFIIVVKKSPAVCQKRQHWK